MIFERTGRSVKTHNGVHTEFARLTKADSNLPPGLRSLLSRSYEFKTIADYGTDPTIDVTKTEAQQAIEAADQFIIAVTSSFSPEA